MPHTYIFQVFVNEQGDFGTPHSLIVDEAGELDAAARMAIPARLGHDETVYVDNLQNNQVSLYHGLAEVDFAGSALVGAIWQLSKLKNEPVLNIRCKRGDITTWQDGDISWLRASLKNNIGNWEYEQLESPALVDAINVADTNGWKKMVWAWIDEAKGLLRARTFASKIGIPEVQANGSGAMNLAGQLQRAITVIHGDGSVIYARPADDNSAELGGRVIAPSYKD